MSALDRLFSVKIFFNKINEISLKTVTMINSCTKINLRIKTDFQNFNES